MSAANLISVNTKLVLQTLVGQIGEDVDRRLSAPGGREAFGHVPVPSFGAVPSLSLEAALRGYHARCAEVDMFEPARVGIAGLEQDLADLVAQGTNADEAVAAYAVAVAEAEPLGRPAPTEAAFAWRVPGPGGHVRHYVALNAVEELAGESPGGGAELKRPWTFGFCVRCCEARTPAARLRGG